MKLELDQAYTLGEDTFGPGLVDIENPQVVRALLRASKDITIAADTDIAVAADTPEAEAADADDKGFDLDQQPGEGDPPRVRNRREKA